MLLTIYDKAGTKRAGVAVNDSSTQSKEVQGENVLSLSFSYYAFVPLDVNDYTDYLGYPFNPGLVPRTFRIIIYAIANLRTTVIKTT